MIISNQSKKWLKSELINHLLPSLLAIFFFEIVSIQIYIHASKSTPPLTLYKMLTWIIAQGLGGLLLGFLSDRLCRKKIFLFTIFWILLFLPITSLKQYSLLWIGVLGIGFNPSPIARATLVDNFPTESKVKLMSWTFIAQFVPWVFYLWIGQVDFNIISLISWVSYIFIFIISIFFFEDKRDNNNKHVEIQIKNLIHKNSIRKISSTLIAFFPAQIIFFLTDSYFEEFAVNGGLYSALGFGSLVGAVLAVFYKKTPHLSMITVMYGIGFLISIMPVASILFFEIDDVSVRYQLMVFSNLGGFYLPFIYDIILSNISSKIRGTACGIIDLVISLSSLVGLTVILLTKPNDFTVVIMTTILFLIAVIIQKHGETDERQKKQLNDL